MKVKSIIYKVIVSFLFTFICNEYIYYYITIYKCHWPGAGLKVQNDSKPVNAMILADIHLLGPYRGHWADKLVREWQMYRAFQTAITLFKPEAVFILGDLFDEGQWVNTKEFNEYVLRFHRLFYTPPETIIYGVPGNHDVGFHYKMLPILVDRFDGIYNNTANSLITIRGVHFVLINSMSMEQDGCNFCNAAKENLQKISAQLKCAKNKIACSGVDTKLHDYSQPILLQHFPTYRKSDKECIEHDAVNLELYRERWEVLSRESTHLLGKFLKPRVVFSGHSHHFCKTINRLKTEEYTISSFSWRNKKNPRFLLAAFTPTDYGVTICDMPVESTVIFNYMLGMLLMFFLVIYFEFRPYRFRLMKSIKKGVKS